MVSPIIGRQDFWRTAIHNYSVGSSGPDSLNDFFLSVLGGLGDPMRLRTFEPSPKPFADAAGSSSNVMFLLHTAQTSAAYAPPSPSRNMLQRMTCPQHTGTHIVEVLSAAKSLLAGSECCDYTLRWVSCSGQI